jgi:hypothetical protein
MKSSLVTLCAGLAVLCLGVAPARAQGALASGAVSALVNDGETSPAFSGSVTYRVNRGLGFGVEVMHASDIEDEPDFRILAAIFPPFDTDTNLTTFTTYVRLDVPTKTARIIPFVIGGGGIAAISREYPLYYALAASSGLSDALGGVRAPASLVAPGILPQGDYRDVATAMVLTLGGGASVLATEHVSIDVDLRVLRLFEQGGARSLGRFGVGASYRF